MKVLVVSNNYPSTESPTYGIFVYNLIQQFVKIGHEVTVIAPRTIWKKSKYTKNNVDYGDELATVYRPYVISASNKQILNFNTHLIGEIFMVRAVRKVVREENIQFDVVYAHFLVNGIIAVKALKKMGKPIVVAEGELKNINKRKKYYSDKEYQELISKINGFIAVSPQIEQNLIEVGVDESKIMVSPNAVNFDQFARKDKIEMRKKLGFPLNKKIIIFVGRFVHDKGPLRVLEALNDLPDVRVIFIGSGAQVLNDKKILFKNRVPTDDVHEFLSASDIFVLPTLHEGSCNAIVEAMACGLPIISSDIPEIKFQCDHKSSILVDPMNVQEINKAIKSLISDNRKLTDMGSEAYEYSRKFDITTRARKIMAYISDNIL
ncbi:glycosyltransferase family 4 protein [Euzebyella marina]|uniref:Glycosyltransferase family 4 protein n=1 Tax=Euzebyella marina TaxID=1761453 RepID=A0A3G2L856_9FLAO|nr:glycosyltransferase family 4 protein [Euzebyella marina]AYN68445.1 glycosyltransferase family 4 protein [Euzebyella marina]